LPTTYAAEPICPKKIAVIANDDITAASTKILETLYRELGCPAEFIALPARRGIRDFNHRLVDGELYRLRQAERLYDRPFARSQLPLFMLSNSLWRNPAVKEDGRHPIGYVLGVVWQENYMKTRKGKVFHDSDSLVRAYNEARVGGMLYADFAMAALVRDNHIYPEPVRGEVLLEAPLYHYLGKEFEPFMKRLSELLKRQPFSNISDLIKSK